MIVRNSFGDENSSAMAQEDERVDVERERVEVERARVVEAGFLAAVEREAAGFFAAVDRDAAGLRALVDRDAAGLRALVDRDAAGLRALVDRDAAGLRAAVERDDDELRPGSSSAATRRARFSTSVRRLFRSSETLCDASSSRIRPTALPISSTVFFFAFFAMARV
jgi:hypothetical protein